MTTGKIIALTIQTFAYKVTSLLLNKLSRFITAFLLRSKHLLISWLQVTMNGMLLSHKKDEILPFPIICLDFPGIMLSKTIWKERNPRTSEPCACASSPHWSHGTHRQQALGAPARPQGWDKVSNTVLLSTSWATLPKQLDRRLGWESKRLCIGGQLCQLSGPSDKFWWIFHLSVDKTQERRREIFPGPHKSRHFGVVSFWEFPLFSASQ